MFEAVLSVCLLGTTGPCRDALLPGYEAAIQADCEAALLARPPERPTGAPRNAAPRCMPAGPAVELTEVASGVFVHVGKIAEPDRDNGGDVANLGVIVGSEAVAVVDAGSAAWIAEGLWRAIRARTALPLRYLVLTHMHPDHVLGADVLRRSGAALIVHDTLPRALADRRENYVESLADLIGPRRFLASGDGLANGQAARTIDAGDAAELDLGDRTVTVRGWPAAHTGGDLTVEVPDAGLMFAGDLVFADHAPALDGSLEGWQDVLAALREKTPSMPPRVVPGHGPATLPWPEGGAPLARYLDVLAADTRAALAQGLSLGAAVPGIAAGEAGAWALFDAYNPRNATVAYTELEWE